MAVAGGATGPPGISEQTGQMREESKSGQTWLVGQEELALGFEVSNLNHSVRGLHKLGNKWTVMDTQDIVGRSRRVICATKRGLGIPGASPC